MSPQTAGSYQFGAFRLDLDARAVSRGGQVVPLAPKTFDLLRLLTQAPGRAFSKRELITALWPDTVVEEANLSFQISVLRKALGDEGAKWIETVSRYGYRFTGDVRAVAREGLPDERSFSDADRLRIVAARHRRAASVWVIAVAGAAVLLAAALAVLSSRSHRDVGATVAPVSVPLTAYPGIEQMPTLSPDGSQVAFSWDGRTQDNADIYVKLVGTGEPIRLTTHQEADDSPAWSPDGLSIAFRRHRFGPGSEVFVTPALGGAERKVLSVESDGTPSRVRANLAWTPDGKWIAVGGRPLQEKAAGIWLVAADGSSKRPLTEIGELDWGDTAPTFSPDGRYLAFIRARRGVAGAVYALPLSSTWAPAGRPIPVTAEFWNIRGLAWVPDGGGLIFTAGGHVGNTRLQRVAFTPTQREAGRSDILPFGERAGAVSISGNGRLVYASDTRDSSLWRLPLPSAGQPLVPSLIAPSTYDEHTPDYSPDGKRLAFASTRSGDEEIWISDADGSNPVQMTLMKGPLCANPRWSPDGTRILFSSRREGSQDLYLLIPDTGDVRRITDHPAEEGEPRWSRDGRWIYFGSNRTGRPEVWKMPAGGGPATQVTHGGGLTASESPDGRFLYYAKNLASPTSIWRVPVNGGDERLVTEGLSYSLNFVIADRGLYFLAVGDAPHTTSIDFLEYATSKRTTLFTVGKAWWAGMAIAPDQRSLLYSVVESQGSNLMLVESFH